LKPVPGGNGRGFVAFVLLSLLATSVTVLVPWLIGVHTLRDGAFRPSSGLVYSISNRDGGTYFLTDYLAGLAITTAIGGGLLVLAALLRIRHRIGRLVMGVGLVALAFAVLIPQSVSTWGSAELATAQEEAAGPPGRYDAGAACTGFFDEDASVQLLSNGIMHTWTAIPIDDDGDGACTQVEIWDGVRLVQTFETPNISKGILVGYPGKTLEESRFVFLASGPFTECDGSPCTEYDIVGSFNLATGALEWTHQARFTYWTTAFNGPDTDTPNAASTEAAYIVLENPRVWGSVATAFDPATGGVVWQTGCPENRIASQLHLDDEGGVQLLCDRTDDSPEGPSHIYFEIAADGTLGPSKWEE
jgi:hypothetical protein